MIISIGDKAHVVYRALNEQKSFHFTGEGTHIC